VLCSDAAKVVDAQREMELEDDPVVDEKIRDECENCSAAAPDEADDRLDQRAGGDARRK
jgi:hypothetical protein